MEAVNGVMDGGGPPPPSPLTGCYLLIVIGEPHSQEHKNIILQRIAKGLLSWDVNDCLIDLEKELAIITEQAPEGEEARYGERLIQYASENLVTEVLIHPAVSTLAQCVRNLLSSFTRHRHIIHAGYTFAANGSWILQDGTFSYTDFAEAFHEIEVQRVIRAYENSISVDLHCSPEGDWTRLPKESFAKNCKVRVNPVDVLTSGSPPITNFLNYISPFLLATDVETLLECSDVVGNIRFSHPTLYIFPGGQGDAALFGINGFNMLLDGGFSRKACFWDFVRHLDRLDAVLLTRVNNGNVSGINAVLRRKMQSALYPQIGHFFCNIQERKSILSPDGDKDRDPLLINLLDEGQEIITNLRKLNLAPQSCYRDTEPINLYHKVGHGTLDMYVLSPARDSKEVRDFIQRWNTNDQKLFANQRNTKDFQFPLQNLVSICALLIWQPANPNDNITRILYPGSTPQQKIFEGVEKLRNLEYVKYPVCSESKLVTSSSIIALKSKQLKDASLEKLIQSESKKIEKLKEKPPKSGEIKSRVENKLVDNLEKPEMTNGVPSENETDKTVKKSDSTDSDKSAKSARQKKVDETKSAESKQKDGRAKSKIDSKHDKKKLSEKKASPTTPKKTLDAKVNGEAKEKPMSKPIKYSPSTTPAKSAKEATNRKVIESKNRITAKKEAKPPAEKKEPKPERKPISRRSKAPATKTASSPVKKANGVQRPDILKKAKLDKEGTTDSSTVSTPSADQKDLTKLTPEELEQLKAQELADLKEEQEVVKEIEAVFRKGEVDKQSDSELRKVKDISLEDKSEPEEYLIIEKEEIEHDSLDTKEDETQKHARDSEESEKMRKLSDDIKISIKEKEELFKQESEEIADGKDKEDKEKPTETSKEASVTSPEDKIDTSMEKKIAEGEQNVALESQPDERYSATVESGATTAPTLPEDERITLDEIKEDNGDQVIEEKHVKEDTKEKDVPVIQLPAKPFEAVPKLPPVIGIRLDKQSHIRDIVKTPDEVADLPVHEEADIDQYHMDVMKSSMKTEDLKLQDRVDVDKEKDNDIAKGIISKERVDDVKEDAVTSQKPIEIATKAEEIKQDREESKTTKQEELKDVAMLAEPVKIKSEVDTKDIKEEVIIDATKSQPDEREIQIEEITQKQPKDEEAVLTKTVEIKPETIDVPLDEEAPKQVQIKEDKPTIIDKVAEKQTAKLEEPPKEVGVKTTEEKELAEEPDDKLEEKKQPEQAEFDIDKTEDGKKIDAKKPAELLDMKDKQEPVVKEIEEKVVVIKSEEQLKKSDTDIKAVAQDTSTSMPETTTKDAESLDRKKIEEVEKEPEDLQIISETSKDIVDEVKKVEKAEGQDVIVKDIEDVKDKEEIKTESAITKEETVKLEEKIGADEKRKYSAAVIEEAVKIQEKIKVEEKPQDKEDSIKSEEKIAAEEGPKDDIKVSITAQQELSKLEEDIKAGEKPKDDLKDVAITQAEPSKLEEQIKVDDKPKDEKKDTAVTKEEPSKIEGKLKAEAEPKDASVTREEPSKIEEKIKIEEKPKDDIKDSAVSKEPPSKLEEKIKADDEIRAEKDAAVTRKEPSKIEEKIKIEEKPKDDIKDSAVSKEPPSKLEEKIEADDELKAEEVPKDALKDAAVTQEEPLKIEEKIKVEEKPKDDIKDFAIPKEPPSKIEEKIEADGKSKDDIKDSAAPQEPPSKIEEEIHADEKPKDEIKDSAVTKEPPSQIEEKIKSEEKPKDYIKDSAVTKEPPSKIEAVEKQKEDVKDSIIPKEEPAKVEERTKAEAKTEEDIDIKDSAVTKEETMVPVEGKSIVDTKDSAVRKEEPVEEKEKVKPVEEPKDSVVTKEEPVKLEEKKLDDKPKEPVLTAEDALKPDVKDSTVIEEETVRIEEKTTAEEKPEDAVKDTSVTTEKALKLEEKLKAEEEPKHDAKVATATKDETVKIEDKIVAEEKPKDVKDSAVTIEEPLKLEEKIKTEEKPKVDVKESEVRKEAPSKIEEIPKDDVGDSLVPKEEPFKVEDKIKPEEKLESKDLTVMKEESSKPEEQIKIEDGVKDITAIKKEESLKLEEKIEEEQTTKHDAKDSVVAKEETVKLEAAIKAEEKPEDGVKDSSIPKEEPSKIEAIVKDEKKTKDEIKEPISQFLDAEVKEFKEEIEEEEDSKLPTLEAFEEKKEISYLEKDVKSEETEMPSLEAELKEAESAEMKEEKIGKEPPTERIGDVKDLKEEEVQEIKATTTKPEEDKEELTLTDKKLIELAEKTAVDSTEKTDKIDIKDIEQIKEKPLTDEELEAEESIHERDVTFYIGDQKLEKTKAEQKEEKQATKEEQKSKLEERDTDDKQRSQDELDTEEVQELQSELDVKHGEKRAEEPQDKEEKGKVEEETRELKKDKVDDVARDVHIAGSSQEAIFDSNKYANGVQEKSEFPEKEKVIIEDEKGAKEIAEQKMKKEDKFGTEATPLDDGIVLNGEPVKDGKDETLGETIKEASVVDKTQIPVKDLHEEIKLVEEKKKTSVDSSVKLSDDRESVKDEVRSGSQTESPESSSEQALQTFKENEILDKIELGRKSPKEREQDVAIIVASVAEVLKSDAPLEEFEGKLPLNITPFVPFTTSYTTELRETHITTVESPIREDMKGVDAGEERKESKISDLLRDSKELMEATSKIISDIKSSKGEEPADDADTGTVHRMLVTTSSEDGGEEIEICAKGTITFPKSSESSGRSSPDQSTQKLRSEELTEDKAASGTSTPDVKVISEREKAEVEDTEKDISDKRDSGKSTPKSGRISPISDSGIIEVSGKQDLGKSGKSTPELMKDTTAKLDVEEEKKSSDSGRSTPEVLSVKTAETLEEPATKVMFDSGRSSPDSKSIDDEKLLPDDAKLEKSDHTEQKQDIKLESKQDITRQGESITQTRELIGADDKSDSIEDTAKTPKPSEQSVDLAKEKVETHSDVFLYEDSKIDEVPPSYEDVEHIKSIDTKLQDIVTKEVQKEIYTLKDEEDNIVKKEVEVKASPLQEKSEVASEKIKPADEKTKEQDIEKHEKSTVEEGKPEKTDDNDVIGKESVSKIADKQVSQSEQKLAEKYDEIPEKTKETQQHDEGKIKPEETTQKIDDTDKSHPTLSKEIEKEDTDKKIEQRDVQDKVEVDKESKESSSKDAEMAESKIEEIIDEKSVDLDEKKLKAEIGQSVKEIHDKSVSAEKLSTSEELSEKSETAPKDAESKSKASESDEATGVKAIDFTKDLKVTEAGVGLKQTTTSKVMEEKQEEDSKIVMEGELMKKPVVEQKDSVHIDAKSDELSKDTAKSAEEKVIREETEQKSDLKPSDPDVKVTSLDTKVDIIKEEIKECKETSELHSSELDKVHEEIEEVEMKPQKSSIQTSSPIEKQQVVTAESKQQLKITDKDGKQKDLQGVQHEDGAEKISSKADEETPSKILEQPGRPSIEKSAVEKDQETHIAEKSGETMSEVKKQKDSETILETKQSTCDAGLTDEFEPKRIGDTQVVSKEEKLSDEVKDIKVAKIAEEISDAKLTEEETSKHSDGSKLEKQITEVTDVLKGKESHVTELVADDAKISKDQQIVIEEEISKYSDGSKPDKQRTDVTDELKGKESHVTGFVAEDAKQIEMKDETIIGKETSIGEMKRGIEETHADVCKSESSLKASIGSESLIEDKKDSLCKEGDPVESKQKVESVKSSSTSALEKGEAEADKLMTTKAKLDGVQSVAQEKDEQFAKVEESKSQLAKQDKELDSSKSSVIVVDDTKTEGGKPGGKTTQSDEEEIKSIKTETSVVEKTVKALDIDKDIKDTVRVFIESEKSIKGGHVSSIASSSKESSKRDSISGKSTPDIADVERDKQWQETLTYEKHIPGSSTPPTVPVSPIVKDVHPEIKSSDISPEKRAELVSTIREQEVRSYTPASDDYEHGVSSTHSDSLSLSQMSRAPNVLEGDEARESDEEDILGSPTSVTSQIGHSPSSQYDFDDEKRVGKADQMSVSFYGTLPGDGGEDSGFKSGRFLDESDLDFEKAMREHRQARGEDITGEPSSYLYEITTAKYGTASTTSKDLLEQKKTDIMTSSFIGTELPGARSSVETSKEKDPIGPWGKPLGLPSPAPPDNKGTPKKEKKLPPNVTAKNKLNDDKKRSESPSKYDKKQRKSGGPIYVDLTYVPHHGNSNYSYVEFFKRIRARYYVFSGIEPSKEVYNALLEAKQTWEDKELEVTIIPTYDTDVLGYWVAENEELLTKYKIDLSPSASRCTINLQDHETSCSAYRLEF